MEKLQNNIGFEGNMVVETQGHSGGVAMLWRYKDDVSLNTYSKNHIDVVAKINGSDVFRLTGIYGEPDRRKRHETWALIRSLSNNNTIPWCLLGYMNNVVSQGDKQGGRPYPSSLLQGFRDVLDDCNLMDMDLVGYPFTWERGAGTTSWIEVRLDRSLVTSGFMNKFPDAKLLNLEVSTSDHTPLLLELNKSSTIISKKSFCFENTWLREPVCKQIVEEVWYSNDDRSFYDKLSECAQILSSWGQQITGNFKKRIQQCKRILKQLKGRHDSNSVKHYWKNRKNWQKFMFNKKFSGAKGLNKSGYAKVIVTTSTFMPQRRADEL